MKNKRELQELTEQIIESLQEFISQDKSPILYYLQTKINDDKNLINAITLAIENLREYGCEDSEYYQNQLIKLTK